jgi:predicted anti-sigma-YlaC factor YlaD
MSAPPEEPRHGPSATAAGGAEATHRLWFAARVGFAALALWVAVSEPWDANGDGRISVHEALLFGVRFLAFPLHVLLSLTPAPVLHALGLSPDAHWPSSAAVAVLLSLPLWGLVLVGGLLAEAWLERALEARRARRQRAA